MPSPTSYPAITQPSVARLDWDAISRAFLAGESLEAITVAHETKRRPVAALLHHHGYSGRVDLRVREFTRIKDLATDPRTGKVDLARLDESDTDQIEWMIVGEGPNRIRFRDLLDAVIAFQAGTPATEVIERIEALGIEVTVHFRRTFLAPFGVDIRWSTLRALPTTEHEAIVTAYKAGKNAVDLGIEYDVDEATIRRILIKNGVRRRNRGTRSEHGYDRYAPYAIPGPRSA